LSGATSREDIASGARAMAPLLLGVLPFGMVCGVVAVLGASLPLNLGLVGAALVGVLVGLCFGGRR
jgi:predicted branched-subunit amino acid permease